MERINGKVEWFSQEKGFGFIKVEGRDKDIFVHYTGIKTKSGGRRDLEEGQNVEFELTQGPKGPQADNVIILD